MNLTNAVNIIFEKLADFGMKLLVALVFLLVASRLIKVFKKWFATSPKLDKLDSGLRSFLTSFITIALYIVMFITFAMIVGIPTASFITALASCGVAIGLALQGSLSNLAGGVMILLFKPFKVGDFIEAAGEAGVVTDITVFYTILKTGDNKTITVPNGNLTNSVIENYSKEDLRRVDINFTAGYDCDVDKVKAVLMQVVSSHSLVLSDPEPFVRLTSHADSALVYTVRAWCKNEDYWTVNFDLLETVKKEFDANGIDIPYPQLDVHMDK